MRLLLDTHILLWTLNDSVNTKIREAMLQAQTIHISLVSLWEIEIKKSLGRLEIPNDFYHLLEQAALSLLPLSLSHIQRISSLPYHHGDPFDRMLIAQAQTEGLTFVTNDRELSRYDVSIL